MMDYLSNLSSRSFDSSEGMESVHPRLPSLFEPSPKPWGVAVEIPSWPPVNSEPHEDNPPHSSVKAGEGPKRIEQVPERQRGLVTATAATSEEVSHLHRSPGEPSPGTAKSSPGDTQPVATVLPHEESRFPMPVSTATQSSYGEFLVTDVQPKPQEAPAANYRLPSGEGPSLVKSGNGSGPASAPDTWEPRFAQPPKGPHEERLVAENAILRERLDRLLDREVSSRAEAREPDDAIPVRMGKPSHHPVEPIVSPLARFDLRETAPKPGPTIQVIIGRIEVRASTAPVPNRPKPKAPASMSLDEYLRRRSGGER